MTQTHFGFQQVPEEQKVKKVAEVFHSVAAKYDVMNDLMSAGLHRIWKAFTIAQAGIRPGFRVLDIAAGTGDLTKAFAKHAGPSGEVWHTDQSCSRVPPMASILHQHLIPPDGGGDTLFASMYAAYEALSDKMKAYLEGLTATHDGALIFDKGGEDEYPVASHPVITVHPETGRKILFVNRGQTAYINEVSRAESRAILAYLFDHIEQPEWQMRFHWRNHSVAFWDNRCTQHRAIWDYWPNVRSGYRMQIKGVEAPRAPQA